MSNTKPYFTTQQVADAVKNAAWGLSTGTGTGTKRKRINLENEDEVRILASAIIGCLDFDNALIINENAVAFEQQLKDADKPITSVPRRISR